MATFWPKIVNFGHFWPKNQVFGHFLQNCTSELPKILSETVDSCFVSFKGSVVSGKILILAIFGQKYIACGDIIWFLAVFGHFLPNR